MYKSLLFLLSFWMSQIALADQAIYVWSISQQSQQKIYETTVECKQPPSIGTFQNCVLKISHLGKNIESAMVKLDGGMPLHRHGLPTTPVVKWSNEDKAYVINGLKFSMPGEWELRLYISDVEEQPKDYSIFKLDIN